MLTVLLRLDDANSFYNPHLHLGVVYHLVDLTIWWIIVLLDLFCKRKRLLVFAREPTNFTVRPLSLQFSGPLYFFYKSFNAIFYPDLLNLFPTYPHGALALERTTEPKCGQALQRT